MLVGNLGRLSLGSMKRLVVEMRRHRLGHRRRARGIPCRTDCPACRRRRIRRPLKSRVWVLGHAAGDDIIKSRRQRRVEPHWFRWRLVLLGFDQVLVGPLGIVERGFELGRGQVAEVAV